MDTHFVLGMNPTTVLKTINRKMPKTATVTLRNIEQNGYVKHC